MYSKLIIYDVIEFVPGSIIVNIINALKFPLLKLAHVIYRDFFSAVKIENFQLKFFYIFLIFAQNIDCGYTLDCEYPQSMFWSKNKKNRYTPANPSFSI